MKVDSKGRRMLSITVVIIDILFILLGIFELAIKGIETLRPIYLMNCSMDLIGMVVGLVVLVCCYNDYQQLGVDQRYYRYFLEATFFGLFVDLNCWVVNEQPALWQINFFMNTIFFMTNPITGYFFWKYVTQLVGNSDPWIEKTDRWVKIVVGLGLAACIINIYGEFLFDVDTDGIYHREAMYPVYMTTLLIVAALVAALIVHKRKILSRRQKVVLSVYLATPLPTLLISIFVYGISLNYIMFMIDMLLMYCLLNVEQSRQKLAMQKELKFAKRIQESVLPTTFPHFPERKGFDVHASMTPTREVGGDFYDFFLIDDDHLGLVIADVSDKGIPAAMCMMSTKTIISNNMMMGKTPGTVLADTNKTFCDHNDECMFVTAWIATLEISSGKLTCANAGHEYPMLKHGDEGFSLFEDTHGAPIGWVETSEYQEYEIKLYPGDMIFVYTDGITEAKNKSGEMFGTDSILDVLSRDAGAGCEKMLQGIWNDVNAFSDGAEQFDDLTMLAVEYKGDGR